MFINSINNIKQINLLDMTNTQKRDNQKTNTFDEHVRRALQEISNAQKKAETDHEKLILNKSGISLNDMMINLQKSSIAIQMAVQVRNKIVSAYQEIMSQQI